MQNDQGECADTYITKKSVDSLDSNKSTPRGVYKNPRLMHVSTTIVGSTVQLQTKDGKVWEGIFATFSPEFSICLDLAVQIDPKLNSQDCLFQALKNGSKAQEKAFFDLKDIVRITVNDVDLNYAIKEMDKIITDAAISGFNPSKSGERRELESWQDDDGDNTHDDSLLSLDEVATSNKNGGQNNSRTGWDAQEMFRYNERVHKVNSTYDEDLHDYTISLSKPGKHDKDWRKKQDRAAAIAREIETNPQSQNRLAKEDGSDDEEEKFSSVVRPQADSKTPHQQQPYQPPPLSSQQHQPAQQPQHHQQQLPHAQNDPAPSLVSPLSHQHQNQHQQPQSNQQHLHQHQQHQNAHHQQQNQHPRQLPNRINNTAHKNLRPRYNPRFDSRIDSLKNFSRQLNIAPAPRQPQNQVNQMQGSPSSSQSQPSPQQSHQKQNRPQHTQHQPTQSQMQQQSQGQQQHQSSMPPKQQAGHQNQQPGSQQSQQPVSQQHPQPQGIGHVQQSQQHQSQQHQQQQHPQPQPHQQQQQHPQPQPPQPQQQQQHPPPQQQQQQPQQQTPKTTPSIPTTTTSASTIDTSMASERSDTSSSMSANQSKDQSELAKKSTLNPNAKEFVYKPRSPASIQGAQANGANPSAVGIAPAMDPTNSSPMTQAAHGAYYQQVPIFSHGLPPHQQQPHHPSQFIPNHAHMHFQSQIHYMPTPMAPHFAPQQVPPRYIRGNFQNYHHRNGEHMNNVRAAYPQTSMAVPTSASGQPYVPPPSGAQPHHMNTFAMGSPQQSIVYGGPPQSVYPMAPANFHQPHMSHVPNPQTYEGYMPPTQNYVINQ